MMRVTNKISVSNTKVDARQKLLRRKLRERQRREGEARRKEKRSRGT
jgi:hypothetical protein